MVTAPPKQDQTIAPLNGTAIKMDIRKLDVFCKVVELRSFTKASQAMQLSQPTVSDHIRSLEEELGHKLVDRLGREVGPTPVGRLLYSYVARILRLQQETLHAVAEYVGQFSGDVLIGASTILGITLGTYLNNNSSWSILGCKQWAK